MRRLLGRKNRDSPARNSAPKHSGDGLASALGSAARTSIESSRPQQHPSSALATPHETRHANMHELACTTLESKQRDRVASSLNTRQSVPETRQRRQEALSHNEAKENLCPPTRRAQSSHQRQSNPPDITRSATPLQQRSSTPQATSTISNAARTTEKSLPAAVSMETALGADDPAAIHG